MPRNYYTVEENITDTYAEIFDSAFGNEMETNGVEYTAQVSLGTWEDYYEMLMPGILCGDEFYPLRKFVSMDGFKSWLRERDIIK